MQFEVEQKFRLRDFRDLEKKLHSFGVSLSAPVVQLDCYFAHPARDFAQTDEALRIRSVGDTNWITYKGPRIDATTKTRQEIEIRLDPGSTTCERFTQLMGRLGFQPVAEVRKQRRVGQIAWQARQLQIAVDDVEQLGKFVELEVISDERDVDASRTSLADLASELKLSDNERCSYLELLLSSRPAG